MENENLRLANEPTGGSNTTPANPSIGGINYNTGKIDFKRSDFKKSQMIQ